MDNTRYIVSNFQPDERLEFSALIKSFLAGLAISVVVAFVFYFVSRWFSLIILFPLMMGVGIGIATGKVGSILKLRHPMTVLVLGFFLGTVATVLQHYYGYLHLRNNISADPQAVQYCELTPEQRSQALAEEKMSDDERMAAEAELAEANAVCEANTSFMGFIDYEKKIGVDISKSGRKPIHLEGLGSYIFWVIEWLIAAIACAYMMRKQLQLSFCTRCSNWKREDILGGFDKSTDEVKTALNSGEMEKIQATSPKAFTDNGPRVTLAMCPHCRESAPVDVFLSELTQNKKGKVSEKRVSAWTYPGNANQSIRKLFSIQQPMSTGTSDPSGSNPHL